MLEVQENETVFIERPPHLIVFRRFGPYSPPLKTTSFMDDPTVNSQNLVTLKRMSRLAPSVPWIQGIRG